MASEARDLAVDLKRMAWARRSAQTVHDDWLRRTTHWRLWKRRISDADAMARGEFHVVFPNERGMVERPKIPNIVQLKLDDLSQEAVHAVQTIRVDPANERGKARAAKRERIASWYAEINKTALMRPWYLIDLALTGASFRVVLPDQDRPCIRRIDPRFAFPDASYAADRGVGNLLVAYKQTRASLAAEYPDLAPTWRQNPVQGEADQLDVLEYYDSEEMIRVAVIPGQKTAQTQSTILLRAKNLLGRCPVVVAARPTHDREFRGSFDQVLSVLNAENRVTNLLIDGAADMLSSPIVEYDIENPEDWGSGAVIHSRSKDGFMRREPASVTNNAIFQILGGMRGDARAAAVYPEIRSGTAHQSIVSAAGLNALSGTFDSEVAALLKQDANATGEALSLCFQVDDKYFPQTKRYITGEAAGGVQFSESYTAETDIKGEYSLRIEIPGAGEDPFSREIRLTQQANNGLIPKRIAREQLSTVKDVLEAERLLLEEQILGAGMAFIAAQATGSPNSPPNFAPAARLIKAIQNNEDVLEALSGFADIQAPQQPQGPPSGPTNAFQEASGLMQGGIGPAGTNVPGVGAMPQIQGGGNVPTLPGEPASLTRERTTIHPGMPPLSSIMVR